MFPEESLDPHGVRNLPQVLTMSTVINIQSCITKKSEEELSASENSASARLEKVSQTTR